jgi:hypothetical protein
MSLLDKIKALFSGGAGGSHDHDHSAHGHTHDEASSYLQSPTDPDEPVLAPTPEETAAAAQAAPPTTTVAGLSEDEPGYGEASYGEAASGEARSGERGERLDEPRDEVH